MAFPQEQTHHLSHLYIGKYSGQKPLFLLSQKFWNP